MEENEKLGMQVSFKGTTAIIGVMLFDIDGDKKTRLGGRKVYLYESSSEKARGITSESQDELGYVEFCYPIEPEKLYTFTVKTMEPYTTETKKEIGIHKNGEQFFEEPRKRKQSKERKGVGFGTSLRSRKHTDEKSCAIIKLVEVATPKEEDGVFKFPITFEIENLDEFIDEVEEDYGKDMTEIEFELLVTEKKNKKKKFKFVNSEGYEQDKKIFVIDFTSDHPEYTYEEVGVVGATGDMCFSIVYKGEDEKGKIITYASSKVKEIKVEGFTAKSISRVMVTKSGIGMSHRISILCMNEKNMPTDAEVIVLDGEMKVMKTKKGILNYDVKLHDGESERAIKISVPSCTNYLQRENRINLRKN